MNRIIESKLDELVKVCQKRHVRRIALFGSATSERFNPVSSDVDLLVEFQPMSPAQYADNYFGLQEDLERLFGVPVDLVESEPIRNPYFRQAVEQTQVVLYDAT